LLECAIIKRLSESGTIILKVEELIN